MNTQRRTFADHEKVAILKRHLIDKVPVSDLCDELDLYPNQFYDWLKRFFENGHLAFANGRAGRKPKTVESAQQARIQQLEAKLHKKNEVMAELMEAHTELKKIWFIRVSCGSKRGKIRNRAHPTNAYLVRCRPRIFSLKKAMSRKP